jgi:hypothetical protein
MSRPALRNSHPGDRLLSRSCEHRVTANRPIGCGASMADYGRAAGASAGRGEDRTGGRDGPAQETAATRVRLFNDLSAKPDICNPMTAGSPTAGSQIGSQRRQAVTDAGRRPATIGAGRWLIRRRPATVHDGRIAPEKRKVRSTPEVLLLIVRRGHSPGRYAECDTTALPESDLNWSGWRLYRRLHARPS